jgi:hypothetical protein
MAGDRTPDCAEGVGSNARFHAPTGIVFQPGAEGERGRLLVVDSRNHQIRAIDMQTGSASVQRVPESAIFVACGIQLVSLPLGMAVLSITVFACSHVCVDVCACVCVCAAAAVVADAPLLLRSWLQPSGVMDTPWLLTPLWRVVAEYCAKPTGAFVC